MKLKEKDIIFFTRLFLTLLTAAAAYLFPAENKINLLLYIIPYIIIGYDILYRAARNILRGQFLDENFLMAIASIGAFLIGEYPEAIAVLFLYQIGEYFQNYAVEKSRNSIKHLINLRPDYVNVIREGKISVSFPDDVKIGETIEIKPGEKIPLDGIITEGYTSVETAYLTGESIPSDLSAGDKVYSGCVNINGLIRVLVTAEYKESTVSKILDLVENVSDKKAKSENFITKFARIYTPAVVIFAVLLAVLPPLVLKEDFIHWLHRALMFIVVSCPCALVISVPLSFFGGIGGASKCGILIKGANYMETLAKIKTVVFDKTGTLTKGSFIVTAVHPQNISEEKLLYYAACAEYHSNHPVAKSILKANKIKIDKSIILSVIEIPGKGINAIVSGKNIHIGNAALMKDIKAVFDINEKSGTVIHIAADGSYLGYIIIKDEIKSESAEAIKLLHKNGIEKITMLTGDLKEVGEEIANILGIDEVYTQLMPADKVEIMEEIILKQPKNKFTAFVGDGINDAPVLMRSDVGIAMGGFGSDAAIEAADVVLMDDNPKKIASAIKISRKTIKIVKQNIIFALSVKAFILIMSALGITGMWLAIFADVGVSIIAILNAMRCFYSTKT